MNEPRKDWHTLLEETNDKTDDFSQLGFREMIVCGCALLADGLVDVMKKRLIDVPKVVDRYIGLEGFTPWGDVIALAQVTGAIDDNYAESLREFAKLRNKAAHLVEFEITDSRFSPIIRRICELTCEYLISIGAPRADTKASMKRYLKDMKDAPRVRRFVEAMLSITLSRNGIILEGMERIAPNDPFKRVVRTQ